MSSTPEVDLTEEQWRERLSPEQYSEIFQDIARTLAELIEESPEACKLMSGRTFARTLH